MLQEIKEVKIVRCGLQNLEHAEREINQLLQLGWEIVGSPALGTYEKSSVYVMTLTRALK